MTRDLRRHPARSEMPFVTALTNVLHQTLGWHRARMTFMARFVLCSLQLTITNLRRIAVSLKAGVEERSNYRRIRRFLADYDVDYGAMSRLLVRLVPQDPTYVLVLDRTEWHFGATPVNVLMIGIAHREIAHRGIAFPIAWTALPKAGSSGSGEQIEVLEAALSALDASDIKALTADREFISVPWLKRLQAASIPFVIRLRSGPRLDLGEDGPSLSANMYARGCPIGTSRVLGSRTLEGTGEAHVSVQILVRRIGSDTAPLKDRFLVLATSGVDPERGPTLYRRRWEVETLFAALKSRGFDLEATHLTAPSRIRRLIGLLAIAFAWSHLVGEKRAEQHGPPPMKAHGRRNRSLFRYGLDRLQSILTTLERQRTAFEACLKALRSPSRFLSGT